MKRAIKRFAYLSSTCFHIKIEIFITLSFLALNLNGQNHFIGFKSGLGWTNNAFHNFPSKSSYRSGFSGGLTYDYLIGNHFSVGANFIYEQRGFSDAMVFVNPDGIPIQLSTKFSYDILSVPIMTGLNIGKKAYAFANIGLCPTLVHKANKEMSTFDQDGKIIATEKYDVTNSMQKFDFSGLVEIGGGYKFRNRCWLYTSVAYQKSFTNLVNSDFHTNDQIIKHYGMYLSMGVKYALTKFNPEKTVTTHLSDDYFLHKSKKQKTKAWVILGSGLGIAAIGGMVQLNHENTSTGWDFDFTGTWIAIAGGGVGLISVPFFISSATNARKAMSVSVSHMQINIPQQISFNQSVQPALSFKIKL